VAHGHVNKAVAYCEKFISDPNANDFSSISDLIEGGNQSQLIRRMHEMVASGVRALACCPVWTAAFPTFVSKLPRNFSKVACPVRCTPNKLPELIEGVLRNRTSKRFAARIATKKEK